MGIEKTAVEKTKFYKKLFYYQSARKAFKNILLGLLDKGKYKLLLPGYIGYSSKEGSGIYDPVMEAGVHHAFYKVNRRLQINIKDLEEKLDYPGKKVVLLVHYFGIPDINYEKVIDICRKYDAVIIEDAAHALYTDFVDHCCGSKGDYTIYSLHKMLPFKTGGMLRINTLLGNEIFLHSERNRVNIFDYDLYSISKVRKQNAKMWDLLICHSTFFPKVLEPLWQYSEDVTYQTYPVIVKDTCRDDLYFGLNKQNFGAVSLYHEMIKPIEKQGLEEALWLSEHILNLPVHQDVNKTEIEKMFELLEKILKTREDIK